MIQARNITKHCGDKVPVVGAISFAAPPACRRPGRLWRLLPSVALAPKANG
jgi:hypothetical protein